jgi:hypothetical protein
VFASANPARIGWSFTDRLSGFNRCLMIAFRRAVQVHVDIRMILSGTGQDADGERRLVGQDSFCQAARSKVYQDHVF